MAQGKSFDMEEECSGLDFHSLRLKQRLVKTMGTLYKRPDKSIWEAGENRAEASD
ncbi:MAG: hypothetical protein LBL45_03705 [Treponema sp.]|jgi:hypothetical protein|nr:hypothetical protein [Treponema sp.]